MTKYVASDRSRRSHRPLAVALLPALLLVLGLPLASQPGPGPGHEGGHHMRHPSFERLAEALELSAGQLAEAKALREAGEAQTEQLRAESRDLREQLQTTLDQASPNPTQVGELVIALRTNREALRSHRESLHESLQALLTPEQQAKLAELKERRRDGRHHREHRPRQGDGPGR